MHQREQTIRADVTSASDNLRQLQTATSMAQAQPITPSNPGLYDHGNPPQPHDPAEQVNGPLRPPRTKAVSPKLGDIGPFWRYFDQETDAYDKDMLAAVKSNMDNLLIFVS